MGGSTVKWPASRIGRIERAMLANDIADGVATYEHFVNADGDGDGGRGRRHSLLDGVEVVLAVVGALLFLGGNGVAQMSSDSEPDRWIVPYAMVTAVVGVVVFLVATALSLRERRDSAFLVGGLHGWYVVEPAAGRARRLSPAATRKRTGDTKKGRIEIVDGPLRWSGSIVVSRWRKTGLAESDDVVVGGVSGIGRTIIDVEGRHDSFLRGRGESTTAPLGFRLVFSGATTELRPERAASVRLSPDAELTLVPLKRHGVLVATEVSVADGAHRWSGELPPRHDTAGRLRRAWKTRAPSQPLPEPVTDLGPKAQTPGRPATSPWGNASTPIIPQS